MAIFYPSHVTDFHGSEGERLVYEVLQRLSNDYVVFYSFRWLGVTGIGFPSFSSL